MSVWFTAPGMSLEEAQQSRNRSHRLTSSAAGSPARISAQPERAQGSPGSAAAYGLSICESFAIFGRDGWSSRTLALFGGGVSEPFSGDWPVSGMMLNGRCYRRPMWEPHTFGSDSSSSPIFPTPSAVSYGSNQAGSVAHPRPGEKVRLSLDSMARRNMWPTATAGDAKSSGSRNLEGSKAHAGVSLTDAVRFGNSNAPRTWATPTTQDGENNGAPSQHERNSLPLNAQAGGALNPEWVELLMGFPAGHTEAPTRKPGSKG